MGTTLQNGVYLPNEGERNCYAGLKTNWEILDQKVADVTALQQAVAGALHREIVASLPTTDIDPNTIYMILSGTSATENVYNEFMYVNNAWELIGTSATDLTNYYTKGDVDGLLVLKANASDLTSHTGDTTIHVTASDKSKWNTVALIKQLRLVNAQVGSATTIAFANIDDTNGIKVGDKCMDLDAKMFEITAIDTTNQTVTVASALIDLALDANVVHTSGNETVGGNKTFTGEITNNISNKANAYITLKNSSYDPKTNGQSNANLSSFSICFNTLTDDSFAYISAYGLPEYSMLRLTTTYFTDSENSITDSIEYKIYQNGDRSLRPRNNNNCLLGETSRRWKSVYATNYYYGSDNTEFSTKFVTSDTAQTITGSKTFSSSTLIYNSDNTANTPNLILQSSKIQLGDTTNSDTQSIVFNAGSSFVAKVDSFKDTAGTQNLQNTVRTKDTSNNVISAMYRLRLYNTGLAFLESNNDNTISLGRNNARWKDCQTYLINGLTPSSLSLPDFANRVDIAGYISHLSGSTNNYTPSVNGWLYVGSNDASYLALFDTGSGGCGIRFSDGVVGEKDACIPCQANRTLGIRITCTNLAHAYFVPCLGNI